jgi:hypothetical protein
MQASDNTGSSRPERRPLPDCLTRLLSPQGHDAAQIAQPLPAIAPGSCRKTYAGALAAIWLDLDRLARLAELTADPARPA